MRVLIVSEGRHELGADGQAGALERLVRRVLPGIVETERTTIRDTVMTTHGRSEGRLHKRAVGWIRHAERHGFDCAVLVVDQDDDADRRRQLDAAQADTAVDLPRAVGVAVRTFDAWMLADTAALSSVLRFNANTQPSPEELDDPKSRFDGLARAAGASDATSTLYARIADDADLAEIARRCPVGFAVFERRVRALARNR